MHKSILILGSGVVGEAIGSVLIDLGYRVEFRDVNQERLKQLASLGYNSLSLEEPFSEYDVVFICVPTPTHYGQPDLSAIKKALHTTAKILSRSSRYCIIAIRSTVPVGTVDEYAIPLLERVSGKYVGIHFGVCANPEYLRERSSKEDERTPRLILIGSNDKKAADVLAKLYAPIGVSIHVVSAKEAEMHKYIHNLYNANKISFFNELRMACKKLTINADAIFPLVVQSAEASWNSEYGIRNLGPFGGNCLPKDTLGFLGWTRKNGITMPLLKGVLAVNKRMQQKIREKEYNAPVL